MKTKALGLLGAVALLAGSLLAGIPGAQAAAAPGVSVVATGLNNPRGLKFGPDHQLYVAEGGLGGTEFSSSPSQCQQVPPPVGPYTAGPPTARVSKINPGTGDRTTVVDHLPSSQTTAVVGNDVSGVADVAFGAHTLYALIAGAGCSHGLPGTVNSIRRVNGNGSTSQVADLSAFLATHPVAHPDPGDFEPDGTWYSMIRAGRSFYAVEPNHQELDRISSDGTVTRVVDFSKKFPGDTKPTSKWIGPTAMVRHGDSLYIGTLTPFPPLVVGAARVFKVDPESGRYSTFAKDLTTVLGLAFDRAGALYVLETTTASIVPPGVPAPDKGQIVKISGQHRTTIATGLNFPTAMTFGPDGNLYVSNNGFGSPPGPAGQIVKVAVHAEGDDTGGSED